MPLDFQELEEKIKRPGTPPGGALIKKAGKCPDRTVFPDIMKIEKLSVPTLFLVCPESDMDYFKIKVPMPPQMFRFRFLQTVAAYVIEIPLEFRWGKQLILHLNPTASSVKKFLQGCIEQEAICFTYYCPETGIVAYSFTGLDEEHIEWAKRNYDRSVSMSPGIEAVYTHTSEALAMQFKSNQRYYRFAGKSIKRRKS